jgi:hypothetical protein
MPSRSKTKGNKFENDIVKCFNELHETEEFRRTPNSGAMMGRSNAAKFAGLSENVQRTLSSDIITPEWYPFAIECKHYGDKPNYAAIIKENDTTLDRWLGEAIFDAINQNLHPMLCFKTDRKGTHVVIPRYWMEPYLAWPARLYYGNECLVPSHYVIYDHIFVIMGLDAWCAFGPVSISTYMEDPQDVGEMTDAARTGFFESSEAKKYLQQLDS